MTALFTRKGRRFVPASASQVAREVDRRSDYRDAVLEALESRPDAKCRTCATGDEGGRIVQVEYGGWVWETCASCLAGELSPLAKACVPGDS